MTYRFLSPALEELTAAVESYEAQQPGLGARFLEEIDSAIRRIVAHPEAWARLSQNTRRCRTHRFPFGIVYHVVDAEIVIVSIMHMRRHPDSWMRNL